MNCNTCAFMRLDKFGGLCHRYPPTNTSVTDEKTGKLVARTSYPRVWLESAYVEPFCGEYKQGEPQQQQSPQGYGGSSHSDSARANGQQTPPF